MPTSAFSRWQDQLAELAFACADARDADAGDLIMAARDLLAQVPDAWAQRLSDLPQRQALQTLIAAGGATSAALALLDGRAGYLLSQAPGGCAMATVVFDGLTGEASAEGTCLATALLGAMAASLAGPALKLRGSKGVVAPAPGARLN